MFGLIRTFQALDFNNEGASSPSPAETDTAGLPEAPTCSSDFCPLQMRCLLTSSLAPRPFIPAQRARCIIPRVPIGCLIPTSATTAASSLMEESMWTRGAAPWEFRSARASARRRLPRPQPQIPRLMPQLLRLRLHEHASRLAARAVRTMISLVHSRTRARDRCKEHAIAACSERCTLPHNAA